MKHFSPMRAFEHVVIDAGTVTRSSYPEDVGKFMYFVSFHDAEGGVLHDYIGASYEAALKSAGGWEAPVFDLSKGKGAAS